MRTIGTLLPALLAALCLTATLESAPPTVPGQTPRTVPFTVLQSFLPTLQPAGFIRHPPSGATETAAGMAFSFAEVMYEQRRDGDLQTISVRIEDVSGQAIYDGEDLAEPTGRAAPDRDIETESGYVRTVTVQGFRASERVQTGETPTAEIALQVAKRFNVTLHAQGLADAAPLKELVGDMDLMKLAQTK